MKLNKLFGKGNWGINLKTVHCPGCGTEQPKRRKPKNFRQAMWGGYTCQNCGCEMDKFGKALASI